MKLYLDKARFIDTSNAIDISLPLKDTEENPTAWYVDAPKFTPVETEHYIGSVAKGGSVNFRDIYFNPHGHGTHTECLGHITNEVYSVNQVLKEYFYKVKLVSIEPKTVLNKKYNQEDRVITLEQIRNIGKLQEALIIRTLPNHPEKKSKHYSNTNPCYIENECADYIIQNGVNHFLIDMPSVDRENDGGELAFHHRFWEVPNNPNFERTITELVYIDNSIEDGEYILSIQMAPFENDASPSRPVLYKIEE